MSSADAPSDPAVATPSIYKEIGRLSYFTGDILGKGGFGSVYKGELDGAGKVAVKRILLDSSDSETELRLVHFGSDIWHEHLARYLHQEKDEHFLYIAIELCVGTLEDLVKKKANVPSFHGPKEEILRQITDGLQFLHKNRIMHRDIKPNNILVSGSGIMKLADFGLSKQIRTSDRSDITNTISPLATGWSAPELLNAAERIRFSADIFALGCVFAFTLTDDGQHPFGGKLNRNKNIVKGKVIKVIMDTIQDEELRELIYKMIQLKPELRPPLQFVHLKLLESLLRRHIANSDEVNRDELVVNSTATERITQLLTSILSVGFTAAYMEENDEEYYILKIRKSPRNKKRAYSLAEAPEAAISEQVDLYRNSNDDPDDICDSIFKHLSERYNQYDWIVTLAVGSILTSTYRSGDILHSFDCTFTLGDGDDDAILNVFQLSRQNIECAERAGSGQLSATSESDFDDYVFQQTDEYDRQNAQKLCDQLLEYFSKNVSEYYNWIVTLTSLPITTHRAGNLLKSFNYVSRRKRSGIYTWVINIFQLSSNKRATVESISHQELK